MDITKGVPPASFVGIQELPQLTLLHHKSTVEVQQIFQLLNNIIFIMACCHQRQGCFAEAPSMMARQVHKHKNIHDLLLADRLMGFLARFCELMSEVDGMDAAEKLRLHFGALAVLRPLAVVSMLRVTGFC